METINSFGNKWTDPKSHKMVENYKEQICAILGIESIEQLKEIFRDDTNVLDIGCGIGWSESEFNVNEYSNRFAVDPSKSVAVVCGLTKDMRNVFVIKADLFELPFKKEFFDVIFANGVLHHTHDPGQAFRILCECLKFGGLIGIYIYCKKPLLREAADMEVRKITTQIPFDRCLKFSSQITKLGRSLERIEEKLIIDEDIPLLDITKGEYDLQKFIYDHFLKCYWNREEGFDYSVLVNQDWYHPKIASHHTLEEILSWFSENSIKSVKVIQPKGWEYSGYFVSGRKVK